MNKYTLIVSVGHVDNYNYYANEIRHVEATSKEEACAAVINDKTTVEYCFAGHHESLV